MTAHDAESKDSPPPSKKPQKDSSFQRIARKSWFGVTGFFQGLVFAGFLGIIAHMHTYPWWLGAAIGFLFGTGILLMLIIALLDILLFLVTLPFRMFDNSDDD